MTTEPEDKKCNSSNNKQSANTDKSQQLQQQQQHQQLPSHSHVMLEPHTRRLLDEGAVYREHKLDTWQLERNYTLAVESRHGIIGESPKRTVTGSVN